MGSDFSFAALIYRVKYRIPPIPEEHREQRYRVAVPEVMGNSRGSYFLRDESSSEERRREEATGRTPALLPAAAPPPRGEGAVLARELAWLKQEWPALVKTLARELAVALAPLLKQQAEALLSPLLSPPSRGDRAGEEPSPLSGSKAGPGKIPIDNLDGILEFLARENARR